MHYIGSKRNLSDWIFSVIENYYPVNNSQFCDLFAGSCEIAKEAKRRGAVVTANDIQYYSYILAKYFLEENEPFEDFPLEMENGVITSLYGGKYFTKENAMKCDYVLKLIRDNCIEQETAVLASLIIGMDNVANTACVYGAYLKKFKDRALNSLSLKQYLINGNDGKAYNLPAEELITQISGDILYLDPPYNTRQYSSNYHVLETIARNDNPQTHGKTVLRNDCIKSDFCYRHKADLALEKIISNAKFKYIFMSYNNEGILSLEQVKNIFEKYGKYSVKKKEYQRFSSGTSSSSLTTTEYLHILQK